MNTALKRVIDELYALCDPNGASVSGANASTSTEREGSNGYTKPGYYGDVDSSYSSGYSGSGKGWVYSADELHVIGLPEGSNGYTQPGYYGDID